MIEDYSMEYLEALIESIKRRTGLNEEQITKGINYNEGYISQTRSRGKVSAKFIRALQTAYPESLQNANNLERGEPQADYESRRSLESTLEKLTDDKLRSTAIIERLVNMLEKAFGISQIEPPPPGTDGTITKMPDRFKDKQKTGPKNRFK